MHSVNCCLQGGGASTAYIYNEPADWPPTAVVVGLQFLWDHLPLQTTLDPYQNNAR